MPKMDFRQALKQLYAPSSKEFGVVEVPPLQFLMIDGQGNPNTAQAYQEALEALYAMAYTLKFMSKEAGLDYAVPPLEGLWWAAEMDLFASDKDAWLWTAMIMQPDWISQEMFERAKRLVEDKRNPPALPKMRLETYREGLAVQILHLGPYEAEAPTIARLHAFISQQGYEAAGKHHEIYLSDPRRTAPEKIKTVIRQPVRGARG